MSVAVESPEPAYATAHNAWAKRQLTRWLYRLRAGGDVHDMYATLVVAAKIEAERQALDDDDVEAALAATLVATMTNWQRNQWARAGYRKSIGAVRRFARMRHP